MGHCQWTRNPIALGPTRIVCFSIGTSFIAFDNNNQLITISDNIRAWDINSGKELWSQQAGALEASRLIGNDAGAGLTPGGDQLALVRTDPDPQIVFFDLSTGREVKTIKLPEKDLDSVQLSFAADGHLQLAAVSDKRLKLWDFNPKQSERGLGPTQKEYSFLKFSRDGRLLAFSENYSIKVWEVATGKELTTLKVPTNTQLKVDIDAFVAFSEDSKRIATGRN